MFDMKSDANSKQHNLNVSCLLGRFWLTHIKITVEIK